MLRRSTVLALAFGACGEQAPAPRPQEPVRRPALPAGWSRAVSPAGFSLGVPPGWRVERRDGRVTLRSGDRALAVLAVRDASDAARTEPLGTYAEALLRSVRGFRPRLRGSARPLSGAPYRPAVTVGAAGRNARGVPQSVQLIALRPPRQDVSALVVLRAAAAPAERLRTTVRRIVRSYHLEPPQ